MKTFETEKHNIPEGATHYSNESDTDVFAWYKDVHGTKFLWCVGYEDYWVIMTNQDHFNDDAVKPIPTTEPKYRYEKVEFELLSDLVVACENGGVFYCENTEGDKNELCMYGAISMHRHSDNLYRRVEISERELFIERCEDIKKATGDASKVL